MQLESAIAEILSSLKIKNARKAFAYLSDAYRGREAHRVSGQRENAILLSYIAGRMPATYAVVSRVLQEYIELGGKAPKTILDIGAGPGTATFAAIDVFDLDAIHLIEKEPGFRDLALELAQKAAIEPMLNAKWSMGDAAKITIPKSDLSIASYALGEMPRLKALELSSWALDSSRCFIVIEPGTPEGFATIKAIRERLLQEGAIVAAPCPHQEPCPMQGSDFCHFSKRLNRDKWHRDIKNASLPYEDEKFAYAIFTKEPLSSYYARIVKRPMKGTGHVTLDLCSEGILERRVAAKSNKDIYKKARKATWGDRFDRI